MLQKAIIHTNNDAKLLYTRDEKNEFSALGVARRMVLVEAAAKEKSN